MGVVGLIASVVTGLMFVLAGASKLALGPGWPEQARGFGAIAIRSLQRLDDGAAREGGHHALDLVAHGMGERGGRGY